MTPEREAEIRAWSVEPDDRGEQPAGLMYRHAAKSVARDLLAALDEERAARQAAETSLHEAREALQAAKLIALNGRICSPPETGDTLMGQAPNPDGKIKLWDLDAMKCGECRSFWEKVDAALASSSAAPARPEEKERT